MLTEWKEEPPEGFEKGPDVAPQLHSDAGPSWVTSGEPA